MTKLAMGFDYGAARIGVAVGQKLTGTATALGVVPAKDGIPDWRRLDELVSEWRPRVLVVGLPLNMDDSMSEMALRASKFARRLEGRYQLPCELIDERLSTFAAEVEGRESGAGATDAIAARLILETWLTA